MKLVRKIVAALVGVVLFLTAVGYLLPSHAAAPETVVTLEASRAELFPLFNSRVGHRQVWTRASEGLGAAKMSLADLGGPDRGVGTRICFCLTGEGFGVIGSSLSRLLHGEGVIVESETLNKVIYTINFGFVAVRRTIQFENLDENTTRVKWSEMLEATNPLKRYVLLGVAHVGGFDVVLEATGEIVASQRKEVERGG